MCNKSVFLAALLVLFFASFSFSQTDSAKTYTIKGEKVVVGKYYHLTFGIKQPEKGKLVAVNSSTILMLIDNGLEEIDIDDILTITSLQADNILYSANVNRKYRPLYSFAAGYNQRDRSGSSYYYSDYSTPTTIKFHGFDISADALIRTSDNFGFRFDMGYAHSFGKLVTTGSYYNSYDTSYSTNETDYSNVGLLSIKTGLLFGSMSDEDPFNFYVYGGIGFGLLFKGEEVYYYHRTKNNKTTTNASTSNSSGDIIFGAHVQVRLSYKVSGKYAVFAEPFVNYWNLNVNRMFGINGGITFLK